MIEWIVELAPILINRCLVGHDGKTAYERLRGRVFNLIVAEFGECVWYKKPSTKGKDKWELSGEKEFGRVLGIQVGRRTFGQVKG